MAVFASALPKQPPGDMTPVCAHFRLQSAPVIEFESAAPATEFSGADSRGKFTV